MMSSEMWHTGKYVLKETVLSRPSRHRCSYVLCHGFTLGHTLLHIGWQSVRNCPRQQTVSAQGVQLDTEVPATNSYKT